MSKPVLNVPGIDPARIECSEEDGAQRVRLDGGLVARIVNNCVVFDATCDDESAVMNAAIDHWRATGRLFPEPKPEPKPEPVDCVCGGKGKLRIDGEFVFCSELRCKWCAPDVASWNLAMAALKAAKEKS